MGYESRIYVMNRTVCDWSNDRHWVWAEEIAKVNMCVMDVDFRYLFDKPIDYSIYTDGDTETTEDNYGEHIKYAPIDRVIEWLEKKIEEGEKYRRLSPLLGLLKGFDKSEWDELQIVHFGY